MTATNTPTVMDSWLVVDGYATGLERHLERFHRGVGNLLGTHVPAEFDAAVRAACAAEGAWFPRIEAADGFTLRLRPAPRTRTETALWAPPEPDPRTCPQVKGPDMDVLQRLRAEAVARGADDAVLHADGRVREAANAALIFFAGDAPVLPTGPRLDSVTVRELADAVGVIVGERDVALADAPTMACWALSSLQEITEVTAWIGADGEKVACPRRDPGEVAAARSALDRRRRAV
ncbi:aminotransferase class IV [Corynebacterium frankenforstense]|uniref:aminotransferase class IV n=1 Tax=Corynebacterium frankenforstense TaxID=1230998 RepID=UPI0026E9692F|nr:aminotransferase class IV [Corynebacterium frankenforstense]